MMSFNNKIKFIKIFFVRLTVVFWALTILISMTMMLSGIFDTDMGAFEAGFISLVFFSIITAILSFLSLGVIDPRKVLMLLKDNK